MAGTRDATMTRRSLAGKALLLKLEDEFNARPFDDLQVLEAGGEASNADGKEHLGFRFIWCQPLNDFLHFIDFNLKMSAPTSYHDAVKYLVNRVFLNGRGRYEIRVANKRIDLLEPTSTGTERRHEVKTVEIVGAGAMKRQLQRFFTTICNDTAGREIWWLGFLRECKPIKARRCSTFLGMLRVAAPVVREAVAGDRKPDFVQAVIDMVQKTEQALIKRENIEKDELDDGEFLYGVENQVTKHLRQDVITKEVLLEQKEKIIERQAAEIEKQAIENKHLKERLRTIEDRLANLEIKKPSK